MSTRRVVTLAVLALAIVAWGVMAVAVRPPRPASLDHADPDVVALIDRASLHVRFLPFLPGRWTKLGIAYEANRMDDAALACYERALSVGDGDAARWHRLAIVQHRLGRLDDALASLEEAVQRDEGYAPLHWQRGFWLLEAGDPDRALDAFDAAERAGAEDVARLGRAAAFIRLDRNDEAIAILDDWRALSGPYEPYARHLLGRALSHRGDLVRARVELARGAGGRPSFPDPWSDVLGGARRGYKARSDAARGAREDGRPEEAISILQGLAADRPNDLTVLSNLGGAQLDAGRVDLAIATLNAALEVEPAHGPTNLNLAAAYTQRGELDAALAAADRAIASNPMLSRAHEARGAVLLRLGRTDEALASLDRAVHLDARNARAIIWKGSILLEQSRWSEARPWFERAVAQAAADPLAWIGLGVARAETGDRAGADDAFDVAAMIEPDHPRLAAARARLAGGTDK